MGVDLPAQRSSIFMFSSRCITSAPVAATTLVGLSRANGYDTKFVGDVDQGCLFFEGTHYVTTRTRCINSGNLK